MMKKITRIAALLAATALLFGAIGCDDGGSSGGGGYEPPATSTGEGSSWEFGDLQGVAAKIRKTTAEIDNKTTPNASAVEALTDSLEAFPTHSSTTDYLQYFYILEDVAYKATSGDKTMTILAKSDEQNYNFHNRYYGLYTSNSITQDVSAGCIEIKGDALSIADVQGPFTVTVLSTANGNSNQTDRGAYIKVGATLADAIAADPAASASSASPAGDKLTYTYNGTDKQTVVIGASGGKSIRIFDVSVEEINTVVDVESVSISSADNVTELTAGGRTTLTATVSPDNATDKTVSWTVSAEDGTTATTAATVTDGVVTAGSVTTDTVVKVFATAGGKKSEAYSITIKAPAALADGTAVIEYDGSASTNTPVLRAGSTSGIFSDVGTVFSATENSTFGEVKNTAGAFSSDGWYVETKSALSEKQDFTSGTELGRLSYAFTLAKKSNITATASLVNTTSDKIGAEVSIIQSSTVKTTKVGGAQKAVQTITTDATELEAGDYTLDFIWKVPTSETKVNINKIKGGVTQFSITASAAE